MMEDLKYKLENLRSSACKTAVTVAGAIRTGATVAGQTAECAVVYAKWKKELVELEALHSQKLRQIGEMVYATHAGNPTDSDTLTAALREVDDLREQIADVKAAIAAIRGTALAHVDGGVPNLRIDLSDMEEEDFGRLIYFFEFACGLSGYLLEVNPFDQPGVEAYKKNMFALLGKPGYEKETEEIKKRL